MKTLKEINVMIKIILLLLLVSNQIAGAQQLVVQSNDDYVLLNNELAQRIMVLKRSDSISEARSRKDSLNYKAWINSLKFSKPFDTLLIKTAAKTDLYYAFLDTTQFKYLRFNKKFEGDLLKLYTPKERENFKQQLGSNNYTWDRTRINSSLPVLVHDTIDEIKLNKRITVEEFKKYGSNRELYTVFAKPIYSIDKKQAIIGSKTRNSTWFSYYKRVKNHWVYQFSARR